MRKIDDSGKTACSVAVQRARRREIAAERLLDDDAGVRRRSPTRPSPATTVANSARRDREVVQRPLRARRAPRAARSNVAGVVVVAVDVAQQRRELVEGGRDRRRRRAARRLSRARARAAARGSSRDRATPMTGTFERAALRPSPAAPGRSSCTRGRRWRRRTPARPRASRRSLTGCFSSWPPNSKRSADSTRFAKSASPRDAKRSTERGRSGSAPARPRRSRPSSVQRPSPESETRPLNSLSVGIACQRRRVRSSSHEAIDAAAAPHLGDVGAGRSRTGSSSGCAQRRGLGVDVARARLPTLAWRRMLRPSA